jgi:hypothetical protein
VIASISSWPAYDSFDANADGILDSWQRFYFGSPSSPDAAPSADPDGDGASNLNEFINLTDPTNSASAQRLEASLDAPNRQRVVLGWPAARGRVYSLEKTSSLPPSTWTAVPDLTGVVGDNTMYLVTNVAFGSAYYRLRASQQRQ